MPGPEYSEEYLGVIVEMMKGRAKNIFPTRQAELLAPQLRLNNACIALEVGDGRGSSSAG